MTADDAATRLQAALGETYEVRRLLGKGGFAEVYVVWDKRLKREIAVKTIRAESVGTESMLERFQREAEVIAGLRHPNLIPLYSVGEEGGTAFYTMPLINGETLAAVLEREGRIDEVEGRRILREAAAALKTVHATGIVHRDVKPENIMLEGPNRSVVVMDFGISKSSSGSGADSGLTRAGTIVGTPQYMSPEQIAGDRADARSDQYALAMVAYRMFGGKLPFEGDSLQTQIYQAMSAVPAPLTTVMPDVSPVISKAVAKALSKRPDDRFNEITDFAAALDSGGRTTESTIRRRRDMKSRVAAVKARPARVPVMVAALVLIAAGIGVHVAAAPTAQTSLVAGRADALFAAQSFLQARGSTAGRKAFPDVQRDDAFRFLFKVLPFDSANRRASTDVPVWQWRIRFRGDSTDQWQVMTGPGNRITGYRRFRPDTQRVTSLSPSAARQVAEREIAARGFAAAQLTPLPDSAITRKNRTDFRFRWRVRPGAIPFKGDTAYRRLSAVVVGNAVENYSEQLIVPDSFAPTSSTPVPVAAFMILGIAGMLVFAVVTAFRRQQKDDLQWAMTLRLVAASGLVLLIAQLPTVLTSFQTGAIQGVPSSATAAQAVINMIAFAVLLFGPAMIGGAAAESLAQEVRPGAVLGLDDLSRGRILMPEIVPAATRGYLIGGAMCLATISATLVSLRWRIGKPMSPDLPDANHPIISQLGPFGYAILAAIAMLLAIALISRVRVLERFTPVVPAVIVSAAVFASGDSPMSALSAFAAAFGMSWAMWRYDFVTALLSAVVLGLLQDGTMLALSGADAGTVAIEIGLFAVPAVLAMVEWRRIRTL